MSIVKTKSTSPQTWSGVVDVTWQSGVPLSSDVTEVVVDFTCR